jgi:ABC-2 type transport system permease protein
MKSARFLLAVTALSLRQQLAFRVDFLFSLLVTAASVASGIAAIAIVFTHTETLGGWPRGEAIVLLGTFQLITVLLNTFIDPNLRWFGSQVKSGALDETLLKPISSLVVASLGSCRPLALVPAVLALATVALGLRDLGVVPSVGAVAAYTLLLGVALVMTWAVRVLAACVTLWFPSVGLDVLFNSAWQFARYPVTIYREPLPFVLTYLVPVAFISTIPTQSLTRGPDANLLLAGLGAASASIFLVRTVWHTGLRRYVSATS